MARPMQWPVTIYGFIFLPGHGSALYTGKLQRRLHTQARGGRGRGRRLRRVCPCSRARGVRHGAPGSSGGLEPRSPPAEGGQRLARARGTMGGAAHAWQSVSGGRARRVVCDSCAGRSCVGVWVVCGSGRDGRVRRVVCVGGLGAPWSLVGGGAHGPLRGRYPAAQGRRHHRGWRHLHHRSSRRLASLCSCYRAAAC